MKEKKIGERNLGSKRTFEIVKKCGEELRHNITHYTNVPKRKNKGQNENKLKKDWKDKKNNNEK